MHVDVLAMILLRPVEILSVITSEKFGRMFNTIALTGELYAAMEAGVSDCMQYGNCSGIDNTFV